jgi:hypothetical protein
MSDPANEPSLAERAAAFRVDVIRPVLTTLTELTGRELGGDAAEELLLLTALHESGGLRWRRQLSGGPALGLYQMEPATHDDIWMHFLSSRPELDAALRDMFTPADGQIDSSLLELDDGYATAMARMHYFRGRQALPPAGDAGAQAAYWKRHYNTALGAGTVAAFLESRASAGLA